jgi:hypothetical protein
MRGPLLNAPEFGLAFIDLLFSSIVSGFILLTIFVVRQTGDKKDKEGEDDAFGDQLRIKVELRSVKAGLPVKGARLGWRLVETTVSQGAEDQESLVLDCNCLKPQKSSSELTNFVAALKGHFDLEWGRPKYFFHFAPDQLPARHSDPDTIKGSFEIQFYLADNGEALPDGYALEAFLSVNGLNLGAIEQSAHPLLESKDYPVLFRVPLPNN